MSKFEMFFPDFCAPDPIKGFTVCLNKPVIKKQNNSTFKHQKQMQPPHIKTYQLNGQKLYL